ncbi:MAG: hypothetical protein RL760_1003, partial [Candidatus Eisenbacteria bacterium]
MNHRSACRSLGVSVSMLLLSAWSVVHGQPLPAPEMLPPSTQSTENSLPLVSGTRAQLDEASWSGALAPWPRGFVAASARDGEVRHAVTKPGSAGNGSSPEAATFADGTWTLGTRPNGRAGHTAIYDPVRDRIIVFGGSGTGLDFNDVWALSLGPVPVWTPLSPSGTPPGGRRFHTAIYDAVSDRMVIFGGMDGTGTLQSDVWTLSLGTSPAWAKLVPLGGPPGARWQHSAVYDAARNRMLVYGGAPNSGAYLNDVWALSLGATPAWSQLSPSSVPPWGRYAHGAIYDPVRDRMVVFGGYDGVIGHLNDVWELSLAVVPAWTRLTPAGTPPSGRVGHSVSYDSVRDRMLVFGGTLSFGMSLNESWALSFSGGAVWTQLNPAGTRPSRRSSHSATFDPVRDRIVVVGGYDGSWLNDRWALSGDGLLWTKLVPAPPGRASHAAIYDPAQDRLLVFGGSKAGDPAIASTFFDDLWAASLSAMPAWTRLTPAGDLPSARCWHTAIHDPVRHRMIVFGGLNSDAILNDVWALSLVGDPTWTQVTPAGTPPTGRYQHVAVYDARRDRVIVFGGRDANNALLNDVWELSLAGDP